MADILLYVSVNNSAVLSSVCMSVFVFDGHAVLLLLMLRLLLLSSPFSDMVLELRVVSFEISGQNFQKFDNYLCQSAVSKSNIAK